MDESPPRERILLVDEDKEVLRLLSEQVLEPLGHRVAAASDAGEAMRQAVNFSPDLIIASLTLPGLSGKDLLVALRSQGVMMPVLVTGKEGQEADALQAFRLGAHDFLAKPLREAEALAAVERALGEVRLRRERQQLAEQLAESNRQLESRVRELSTLYAVGKAVISTTDLRELLSKIIEGSLYVAEADIGWILLQDESDGQLILRAQRNLPTGFARKLEQTWDDGMSSLVVLSGEPLRMHGEGLKRFEFSKHSEAVLLTPIKVGGQSLGVVSVARRKLQPFSDREQALLEALSDYAAIALVNARLLEALEAKAKRLQQALEEGQADERPWRVEIMRHLAGLRNKLAEVAALTGETRTREDLQAVVRDLEAIQEPAAKDSES
jgi:DNA-binding response OmpR family regulator